jgi:autotransporter-associated beta strand protein
MKTPLTTLCILVATALAGANSLRGAELVWDADTGSAGAQDGTGTWTALASNTNWWNGSANVVWDNSAPDSAIFGANAAAAGTVTVPANTTNGAGNISFGPTPGGSYVIAAGSSTTSRLNLSGTPTITVSNGVSAAINVVLGGSAFTKSGGGILTNNPGNPNLTAGTTYITGGTLVIGGAASNRRIIPGDLIVTNNGSSARLGASENITNTATLALYSGATLDMNGKSQTLSGLLLSGANVLQSGTELLSVTGNVDAQSGITVSASGKIDAGTFTKSTAGTVTLQTKGSIKEAGLTNTIVNAGVLVLDYGPQNSSKLSDNGSLIVNGGALILTNGSHAEAIASMVITNGTITNAAGTARFTMSAGNYDVRRGAIYAVLAGAAGLTKTTPDTVLLAAANSYGGGTLISDGVLQLGDGNSTGSVSGAITNNAVLLLDPAGTLSFSSAISGSGSIIKIGGGTAAFTAVNGYQGATILSNGVLSLDGDATLGDGANTLFLSGGALNTTAARSPGSAPISNPVSLTADSAITTTSTAISSDVDLNLASDSFSGTAGTLTFSNANGSADSVFAPRLSGDGFIFARPIVIANGAIFGTTRLNSFNTTGTTQTFSGVISGPGGFRRNASTISSGGVTIFSGNNTYTGPTEVNRGTLLLNGSLASPVTVGGASQDGTLGGNGIINAPVTIATSGTLSPGTSIGCLTIFNSLTLQSGSTTFIELNKTPMTNDTVRGVTTLTFGGTLVVTNLSGALAQNDSFKLFEAASYSGAFDTMVLPPLTNGMSWDISNLTNNGTLKITGTNAVPPQIGSIAIAASPAGVVITGNGGQVGVNYCVLTTTNLALPVSGWTPVVTNQFGAGGSFSFTNAINPAAPKMFYIIRSP